MENNCKNDQPQEELWDNGTNNWKNYKVDFKNFNKKFK
jgi:hypothetical protein